MDDLISRQMALDDIDAAIDEFDDFHENDGLTRAEEILADLPSIQPTPCDVCRYNPPSSGDGKPCCACPAEGRTE